MEKLNAAQAKAAAFSRRHSLIIAGAGTGKTSTLIAKTAGIITDGCVEPCRVALLTFSKKAAEEMRERLRIRLGKHADSMFVGTYHAFCLKAVRLHEEAFKSVFGYMKFPSLLTSKQEMLIDEKFYNDYGRSLCGLPFDIIPNLCENINSGKISEYDLVKRAGEELLIAVKHYSKFRNEEKRKIGAFEFDDLITWCNLLYKKNRDFRTWVATRFDYLLVDEFQDTSGNNFLMINNMLSGGATLCAVGDDYQSIYGFRKASPEIMIGFKKYLQNFDRFMLTVNYRSAGEIVAVSNRLIRKNRNQIHKKMVSNMGSGGMVNLCFVNGFDEECRFIAEIINLCDKKFSLAVLYRNNAYGSKVRERLSGICFNDNVNFSTFHSSKGLEYDHVIICGLHNSQVPSPLNCLEEERRLMYVAITRARIRLDIISFGEDRRPLFVDELGLKPRNLMRAGSL
ncbi:MAG: ATP-dependent helicase [Spirochaetes bacterium]|nr:ATP-dependent helicase [Spirochaetota bacterium]MBN2769711.1 ATP-dependent helicase [Spirochaetota bacterium]